MNLTYIVFNHQVKSYEVSTIIMFIQQMEAVKHKELMRDASISQLGSEKASI